jgi:ABC-2 type transport system permease protein
MSSPLVNAAREETVVSRRARQEVTIVSARKPVSSRIVEIWKYRELLLSLVRKELKVKYKDSVLGFAWSMLNPAFTLTIYYVVFQIVLGSGIPRFAIYLLSGLLVWNFFSNALAAATGSVTGNGSIVKKVSFPREVLPLASVGAAAFNFFLQLIVMAIALVGFRHVPSPSFIALGVVAFVILVFFASGLSIFLAAVNVKFRDTQHLLELVIMAWFWATPIVYQFMLLPGKFEKYNIPHWLMWINPITPITLTFQHAFYNQLDPLAINVRPGDDPFVHVLPHEPMTWYALHLGTTALLSAAIMWGALVLFGKLEGNFAEEL